MSYTKKLARRSRNGAVSAFFLPLVPNANSLYLNEDGIVPRGSGNDSRYLLFSALLSGIQRGIYSYKLATLLPLAIPLLPLLPLRINAHPIFRGFASDDSALPKYPGEIKREREREEESIALLSVSYFLLQRWSDRGGIRGVPQRCSSLREQESARGIGRGRTAANANRKFNKFATIYRNGGKRVSPFLLESRSLLNRPVSYASRDGKLFEVVHTR